MSRDFHEDVKLDKFRLDDESAKQASSYLYWSEQLLQAKERKDRLEGRIAMRTAELELGLRANPPAGMKITEASVQAWLAKEPELADMASELVGKRREVAEFEAAVRALDQKKSMIENTTRLYLSGYYADPGREVATNNAAGGIRGRLNQRD